ncbi:MAG: fumarate hydratase [Clostridiales bacterium]|jgi:fumarate hydratase subunit alpha|nr:fumarate hydratase [Clostridiales bacterium]
MREIQADLIKDTIKTLFLDANISIGEDVSTAIESAYAREKSPIGKTVLKQIQDNNRIAAEQELAICQDTGYAIVFVTLGQDVHIVGGGYSQAINQGVREAYEEGYFRKSVVDEPIYSRKNTGDNTPAIIYTDIAPGENIDIEVAAKGFGSENMSAVKMLVPSDGEEGVIDFIVDTVRKAGPNPCPPIIVGVGVGGTLDKACVLAKKATMRTVGSRNAHPAYAALEEKILERINKLGVGPAGFGGDTTAIGLNIEYHPTHIAGMPVAVNICCHASRHGIARI